MSKEGKAIRGRPPGANNDKNNNINNNKNDNNVELLSEIQKMFSGQEVKLQSELNSLGQNLANKISGTSREINGKIGGNKKSIDVNSEKISNLETTITNLQGVNDEMEKRIHRFSNIIIAGLPEVQNHTDDSSNSLLSADDHGKIKSILNILSQKSQQPSVLSGVFFKVRRLGKVLNLTNDNNNEQVKPRMLKVMVNNQYLHDCFKMELIRAKATKTLPKEIWHVYLLDDLTSQQQRQLKEMKINAAMKGEKNVLFKKIGLKITMVKKKIYKQHKKPLQPRSLTL